MLFEERNSIQISETHTFRINFGRILIVYGFLGLSRSADEQEWQTRSIVLGIRSLVNCSRATKLKDAPIPES